MSNLYSNLMIQFVSNDIIWYNNELGEDYLKFCKYMQQVKMRRAWAEGRNDHGWILNFQSTFFQFLKRKQFLLSLNINSN